MLDILIYIFETYIYNNKSEKLINYDYIISDLLDAGCRRKDIYHALRWLRELSLYKKNVIPCNRSVADQTSVRIYTQAESLKLTSDCRSFILFLETSNILNYQIREIIIERSMALDIYSLNLENIQWVILIILFELPGCQQVYKKFKNLLFHFQEEIIH